MFYDWMKSTQEFNQELPAISDTHFLEVDSETHEIIGRTQPRKRVEGSYCTSIDVRASGNRLTLNGNPSRINRLDNLFGLTSLEQCFFIYNQLLDELKLPNFTKCTQIFRHQGEEGSKVITSSDGAIIQELHITSNRRVGRGHVEDYLRGLSTLHYRYMEPRLHTNGQTTDWLSVRNHQGNASSLMYPSTYNKAYELELHLLPKIKRKYGEESEETKYVLNLIEYCKSNGVVRFEQKLKSAFLRKYNFRFYGLFDEKDLKPFHNDFLNLDNKLQVTSMDLETISEKLVRLKICNGTRSANTTAMYALQWMHGQTFDPNKSQVKIHRARLRVVGIDIFDRCNISKHSPIQVRKTTEIEVKPLLQPNWYRSANVLRLVA